MSRKNTILIAVIINIGLLGMLFFTATKQQEKDLPINPSDFLVEEKLEMENSLERDEMYTFMKEASEENPIVHKLPEIIPQKKEPLAQVKPQESSFEICIKKGDSLEKIAKTYKVAVDDIVQCNNLKTTIIRIGQVLQIPSPNPAAVKIKRQETQREYYIVKPGDNPWTIAMKHSLKVEDLLQLNNLDKEKARKLRPGNKLRIR